uniref:Putative F-box protein n=1 Tax=Noccaea caerulescens TaxID=107243 RepID=A0A1J3HPQ0_NOCCA
MAIGEFQSESFGTCSLPSLPEDVFAIISRFLSPSDICNLSFCCKSLCDLVGSEEIWLAQCELVKVLPLSEILQWRTGISSYKALCRFLVEVMKPLVGIWVHQSPELGNVVYVMPGYLSVVGCRIIPQKFGPLGIQEGRVMWSPVFEIICGFDGSNKFFLHGRDGEDSCLYPGFVTGIEKSCNVLHLEVEPRREKSLRSEIEREEASRKVSFSELTLSDKKDLLELVTSHVGLHDGPQPLTGRLFPTPKDDERMLSERRTMLLKMHKFGGNWKHKNLEEEEKLCYNPMQVDIERILKTLANDNKDMDSDDDDRESRTENLQSFLSAGDTFGLSLKASYTEISSYIGWPIMNLNHFSLYKLPIKNQVDSQEYTGLCELQSTKRKSFSQVFRSGIKHILRRSSSKNASRSSEIRRANLKTFLSSGDVVGLSVKATKTKLSSYRGWPNMHETHFALYKLPIKKPVESQEYAGLWGGTFGWPPGKCSEDKPGKAMFLLMLGYEESQDGSDERLLIGTKILEGTHYVMHPNGSAMFVVKIDSPSFEPFPFDDANGEDFECSYTGEGIAKGYGFRYPGYKPGSLFVTSKGLLVFVWKETRVVLTLQRLDLEELLKKGVCVSPLPPCLNFTYLTKSHTNVFASGRRTTS